MYRFLLAPVNIAYNNNSIIDFIYITLYILTTFREQDHAGAPVRLYLEFGLGTIKH